MDKNISRRGFLGAALGSVAAYLIWPARQAWAQSGDLVHCNHVDPFYATNVSIAGCMGCLQFQTRDLQMWVEERNLGEHLVQGKLGAKLGSFIDFRKENIDGTLWVLQYINGVLCWTFPSDPTPVYERVVLPEHRGYAFGVHTENIGINKDGEFVQFTPSYTYYHYLKQQLQGGVSALSARTFIAV